MNTTAAQALLPDAQQLLRQWESLRTLALMGLDPNAHIGGEQERNFLDLKSAISTAGKPIQATLPKELSFNEGKISSILKNCVSLSHLRGIGDKDRETLLADWHEVWLQLTRSVGGIEMVSQGWKPLEKKSGATTIAGIKGRKKAKGFGAKQIVIGLAVIAGLAIGAMYFLG